MPQTLDDYLAQINTVETPEQKRDRLNQALLVAGLGLLGTRKGQELPAIGRAGLLGVTQYNQAERDNATERLRQMAARNQAIQAYVQEQGLREQARVQPLMEQARRESVIPGSPAIPAMGPPIPEGIPGRVPGEMAPSAPARPPGFDFAGYANRIAPLYPEKSAALLAGLAKESPFGKVTPDPTKHTRESIAAALAAGNPALLVAKDTPPETIERSDGRFKWLSTKDGKEIPGTRVAVNMSPADAERIALDRKRLEREEQGKSGEKWVNDLERGLQVNMTTGQTRPITDATGPVGNKAETKARQSAGKALAIVNEAEKYIDSATGSYGGAALDVAAQVFGKSTEGANQIAKLQALEGALMLNQPRMEGPQSDKDTAIYRQMAGKIGDPTVPREQKKAALAVIKTLHQKYAGPAAESPDRQVVRRGTAPNGKRVVQYSDGTIAEE